MKDASPHLRKLEDRSNIMVFIDYELGSKAYRVYNPKTRRVHVSRDILFEEENQWSWEFTPNDIVFNSGEKLTIYNEFGEGTGNEANRITHPDARSEENARPAKSVPRTLVSCDLESSVSRLSGNCNPVLAQAMCCQCRLPQVNSIPV